MTLTKNGVLLVSALVADGFVDGKAVLANALGTIIGGIFLTLFYFAIAQKVMRPPRLTGTWVLESTVSQTKYNPFRGMVLRYRIMLMQDGTKLHGTAEKVYEKSDKERIFTGTGRTTSVLDGTINNSYIGRSTITLHVTEDGEKRSSSWIVEARCRGFGRRLHFTGDFSGTASDASGTASLKRIHQPNLLDEYFGLPIGWCSRIIEAITFSFYNNDWNRLKREIQVRTLPADEFWRTHNCQLPVAALVLAEDRRFYSHGGTDPIAICRALYRTIVGRKIQGGSTIEQQLVRRLTSDYRKSVMRKLKEIVLAVRLHRVLRKDQIPVVYLLSAYYGWRMNGVLQAARRLSMDLKDPTGEESAQLIARIRYPEPRHPSPQQSMLIAKRKGWIARELRARIHLLY